VPDENLTWYTRKQVGNFSASVIAISIIIVIIINIIIIIIVIILCLFCSF
jgi:hypothetical protein